jgi:hypothetical protein
VNGENTWKRRVLLAAVAVGGVVIVIATVGYVTRPDPSLTWASRSEVISFAVVPGGVAAESLFRGPRMREGGRAAGFAHDELGAVIAASNLAPRVTPAAGPEIYEATLREQCFGDIPGATAQLRAALPSSDSPSQDALLPRAVYYRVLAGDPTGEHVVVSLLAETPQARTLGGLSRVDVTLRWSDGDWRLRVPLPRPALHQGTAGYILLGRAS